MLSRHSLIYYKLQINPHASDPASANDASTRPHRLPARGFGDDGGGGARRPRPPRPRDAGGDGGGGAGGSWWQPPRRSPPPRPHDGGGGGVGGPAHHAWRAHQRPPRRRRRPPPRGASAAADASSPRRRRPPPSSSSLLPSAPPPAMAPRQQRRGTPCPYASSCNSQSRRGRRASRVSPTISFCAGMLLSSLANTLVDRVRRSSLTWESRLNARPTWPSFARSASVASASVTANPASFDLLSSETNRSWWSVVLGSRPLHPFSVRSDFRLGRRPPSRSCSYRPALPPPRRVLLEPRRLPPFPSLRPEDS